MGGCAPCAAAAAARAKQNSNEAVPRPAGRAGRFMVWTSPDTTGVPEDHIFMSLHTANAFLANANLGPGYSIYPLY